MPTSISKHFPGHNRTIKIINFTERSVCKYCKKPMKIVKISIIDPIVGLLENYDVSRCIIVAEKLNVLAEKRHPYLQKTRYIPIKAIIITLKWLS